MVYFFESKAEEKGPLFLVYMGEDKEENEVLIKYGWPEDVWFHVDDLSSAHVYLRLPAGYTIDTIPEPVLTDCCQLVKANSIQGNKVAVKVCYTRWTNLKKRADMDIGQIGFHDEKAMKLVDVPARLNAVVNRLNRTRSEQTPELFQAAREARDAEERKKEKARKKKRDLEAKAAREAAKKDKEAKSYDNLIKKDDMKTNRLQKKTAKEYEDDFL